MGRSSHGDIFHDPNGHRVRVAGEDAGAHDQHEAARIAGAALLEPGLPSKASELVGRRRWTEEKSLRAVLIPQLTAVKNR